MPICGWGRRTSKMPGVCWFVLKRIKAVGRLLCFYVFSWLLLLSFVFPECFLETGDDPSEMRGEPSQLGVPPVNSEIDMWNSPWSFLRAAMSFLYILQCWRISLFNLFHHWFHHNDDVKWQITWMIISEWSILRNPHIEVTPNATSISHSKGVCGICCPCLLGWCGCLLGWFLTLGVSRKIVFSGVCRSRFWSFGFGRFWDISFFSGANHARK